MNGNNRRRGNGYLHLWFAVFLGIGAFTVTTHNHNDPVEQPAHRQSCEGTPYTEDEADSVQTLVDAGWHITGSRVYPPGCGRA
jgi:hypothetical protein